MSVKFEEEEWRPAAGWEELYSVSTFGRVRSDVSRGKWKSGRIMKPSLIKNGYLMLSLYRDGNRTAKYVHNIVAETFIGPRPHKYDVRHLDGDRTNNRLSNLSYGSRQANNLDVHRYGGRFGSQKLSLQQVSDIRRRIEKGESLTRIASIFGVNDATISDIKALRTWSHLLDQVPPYKQESEECSNM